MDKNYCSSSPDSVHSLMSAEPVDSRTVSSNTELPLAAQSVGLSSLASPERVLSQSDTGDGCMDELDDWKKVSYFNPMTGTSIIKITSEMFKKSRAKSIQVEGDCSVGSKDSNLRCNCEIGSRDTCGGKCVDRPGDEALLFSGTRSTGGGQSLEQGCFRGSESVHFGHSFDIFGDEKVELDNDKYSSDILFIDEPDYAYEEKVIDMDKEEQTTWESVVTQQTKKPTGNLKDDDSLDVFKHRSFTVAQPLHKESPLQFDTEKRRGDQSGACAYKESGAETGSDDYAAVDFVENDYRCSVVTDHNKMTSIASLPKSLNVNASDCKSKISPGPLRLTRQAKSTAQPEFPYSVSTPSFFSAYHPSDVNINNNTCQTSVTNIMSFDSCSSNRDETKGWTRDRGSFAHNLPESSVVSDSWAELEDLPSQSLDMRTSPEKISVDDLSLSKSDIQGTSGRTEEFGGMASHDAQSEPNHVEVGQGQVQSEKLKLMQNRKEKKLNRLKAGVIDSREICGNKGDRSIEELLEFINSKEMEQGKSKKTSQKAKKQQVAPLNQSRMNFTIKVTVTDEILYNWQSPDAASALPNGFITHGEREKLAAENSMKVIEESTSDSYTVTVLGTTSNRFTAQGRGRECVEIVSKPEVSPCPLNECEAWEESKECAVTVSKIEANLSRNGFEAQEGTGRDYTETVKKPEASPSLTNAVSTNANGFEGSRELGGTARVGKRNKKEKSAGSSVEPLHAVAELASTDTVTMTSSSSLKSTSDSSSEALATDDNDSSNNFTVVQKKKRNKNTHSERLQSHKAKTESSVEFGRTKMHNGRLVHDNLKAAFLSKYPQQYRKSTVDNRHPIHPAWGALLKVRPTKGEVPGKNSSGDSSETSSVCSASVQRESTSFAKVALGSTASDAVSQSLCKNSETPIVYHKREDKTLQDTQNVCESQQNAGASGSISEPTAVPPYLADHCHSSSQDRVAVPTVTDDVSGKKGHSAFTDTGLGSDSIKASLPSGKVALCQSSALYQETTLSSSAAGESSTRVLGRSPVVFDTREKSRFLAPASDIEISFGFDADDEGTTEADAERGDTAAGAGEARISSTHRSQAAPESASCNAAVDINSNNPLFQGSTNKSAVIAFPSHGFQPSASHIPLIYGSPHPLSLGVGYVVPVPVGIVPPFMTCNTRPATAIPRPAFESKDFLAPISDFSIEGSSQKQGECCTGICAPTPAWLMVSSVPHELPSARFHPSSKLERRSNDFDLAAAQAFLSSEFEAAISSGSGIVYLNIDDSISSCSS